MDPPETLPPSKAEVRLHVHFEDSESIPTLTERQPFDPVHQAELLHDALKGLVAKNKVIMEILTTHNNTQRQRIIEAYKSLYHKSLQTVIKHELNIVGHYEQTVMALLHAPAEYDAHELHHALSASKLFLDEETLIEILCSRSNHELIHIRTAYTGLYHKDLLSAIKHDTKGEFEHFLTAIVSARREESAAIDIDRAILDAKNMHSAEVQHWGHPESVFIDILATRSYKHLLATFQEFEKLTGHDFGKSVEDHMHGDVKSLMLALVKYVKNKHAFFAECLYNATKGLRVNDNRLIRIIVGRCEKDLANIKIEFQQMYGTSLQAVVKEDTSGNYRHILLALAGYDSEIH